VAKSGPRRSSRRRWLVPDDGASSVEFALSATIFFAFVFGIMAMSGALFTFHFVSEAAREGSRYAMVRGTSSYTNCVGAQSPCPTSAAAVQSYVQGLSFPGVVGTSMTVTTTYSAFPTGSGCSPNANCENPGNLVTVKVVYAYPLRIPFMPVRTLNLTSTSAMIISQ
jgi:Flp pilus assembly protein TadG